MCVHVCVVCVDIRLRLCVCVYTPVLAGQYESQSDLPARHVYLHLCMCLSLLSVSLPVLMPVPFAAPTSGSVTPCIHTCTYVIQFVSTQGMQTCMYVGS